MQGRTRKPRSTVDRARRPGQLWALRRGGLITALLVSLLVSLLVVGTGMAAEPRLSREQAVEQALRQNGGTGKVLGVRQETQNGVLVYAVKILTDGHVRVYRVRAD